ncbi:PKS-ER domain-containing protein [Mycena venus]|uniref:PKS-ER domain-containing protein n=1 Tax=Mycena venus TaxID=2733690 RepID=A0A8H6YUJ5_9AGAR|nr:PKS-ER domain-containing protein [Mycena venus]
MAPVTNGRVLFNAIPEDYPVPGKTVVYDTTETIDFENVPLNGGILIKVLLLSLDPYMRGRLRAPEIESYMPAFPLGEPLTGGGIGVVLRSENDAVKAGTHVRGWLAHQQYYIAPNLSMLEVIDRDSKLDWSVYIGAAGMPGETAFAGWREYSEAKKGEVAFITTGAGPVGSMVIQIAKQDGVKVIASAGSEEKVKFMREIGADVVFNYKTTDVREVLKKEGPIDIYWDNVGGDTLDAAMEFAAKHSRFIECGQISGYNQGYQPMKNPGLIFAKCMHFHGFLLAVLRPKHSAAFQAEVVPKLVSGEYKFTEDISHGLDKVGDVLLAIQKGTNKGKAIVRVADE